MMEYRIVSLGIDHFRNDETRLNALASDGWRVVTTYVSTRGFVQGILERTTKPRPGEKRLD